MKGEAANGKADSIQVEASSFVFRRRRFLNGGSCQPTFSAPCHRGFLFIMTEGYFSGLFSSAQAHGQNCSSRTDWKLPSMSHQEGIAPEGFGPVRGTELGTVPIG
jgi:hypothetical protein